MPIRLDSTSPDFSERFAAFLATKRETAEDVDQAVRAIIADVRKRGDRALAELTLKFDGVDLDTRRVEIEEGVDADQLDRTHHLAPAAIVAVRQRTEPHVRARKIRKALLRLAAGRQVQRHRPARIGAHRGPARRLVTATAAKHAAGDEQREQQDGKDTHRRNSSQCIEPATTAFRHAEGYKRYHSTPRSSLDFASAAIRAADGPRGPNAARALCKERLT